MMDRAESTARIRRQAYGWRQFSLRTFLIVCLLVTFACSWFAVRVKAAQEQHAAVEAIRHNNGIVLYDYEYAKGGLTRRNATPPGSAWLRDWFGVDFIADVAMLDFITPQKAENVVPYLPRFTKLRSLNLRDVNGLNESSLTPLGKMSRLEQLMLRNTEVSDALLAKISRLRTLERLELCDCRVTDSGAVHLRRLNHLQNLDLTGNEITNAALANLEGLKDLRYVRLARTQVSDDGLVHLTGLVQLGSLGLSETNVTDAGVRYLCKLRALVTLALLGTHVTPEGVKELGRVLPNCSVVY